MTKNPIINALCTSDYIYLVVTFLKFLQDLLIIRSDTFFVPITPLFVVTLSVTVMAFMFFYQPLQLFIEGKKKQALNLFIRTVGIFAVITTVVVILLFSGLGQ